MIYERTYDDADDWYMGHNVAFGYSTGLNIRYGILMVGLEFETVSPELESDDHEGVYLQNLLDSEFDINSSDNKSKLPCMNFTLGLSF